MNLHAMASGAVGAVNPFITGTIQLAAGGYTTDATGHRTTTRPAPITARMQVQALTEKDVLHLDALNVAGSTHTVYVNGRLDALLRPDNKGGDLLMFGGRTWLVTAVLEDWPDWCKCSVTLQNGS